jgi:putative copper resistance protein D
VHAKPPDWAAVSAAWSSAPVIDGMLVLACATYTVLAVRARRAGRPARTRCLVSWAAAILTIVLAVNGPVGVYSEVLFWVHMIQHLLLIMVAPVLLVWARSAEPLRRPAAQAPNGRVAPRGRVGPVAGLVSYTAVVVLTHLTGLQQVSATHPWVRALELMLYLAAGYWFLWPLVDPRPGLAYLMRFAVLGLGMGADTLTGVTLMLTGRALAPVYSGAHPGWGPTALADQELAGAIMWFGGDLLMMVLMILTAVRWSRADADDQGLGQWLEGARRRALLGATAGADADADIDVDSDERALDAYNATLAALHGRPGPRHDDGRAEET